MIPHIHVGGDQLTRERCSGAKHNIVGVHNLNEGFEMLSPFNSEFFHMTMNSLPRPLKRLWNTKSSGEIGTLKAAQSRLDLQEVNSTVEDHYSA